MTKLLREFLDRQARHFGKGGKLIVISICRFTAHYELS